MKVYNRKVSILDCHFGDILEILKEIKSQGKLIDYSYERIESTKVMLTLIFEE